MQVVDVPLKYNMIMLLRLNVVMLLIFSAFIFACSNEENNENNEEYLNRISELEARELELQSAVQEKDSAMMTFMKSIAEIENNLREIRAREMNIELASQEDNLTPEDLRSQISDDIAVIDRLIGQNKRTINNLGARLRKSNQENEDLNVAMRALEKDLTQKIQEGEYKITLLKDKLDDTQATVKELLAEVDSLVEVNNTQTIRLNTGYFVIGDYKTLKDEQILDKEGGFLGILGRTETVRDDFDRKKFTRIDIREKVSFSMQGKDVELITIHPPSSYTIDKVDSADQVNLVVSDPESFWESSKYLVMMKK
jgi:predicted  nucleic acid-binding Zn-ribbon protein